jgi:hypothetical protein
MDDKDYQAFIADQVLGGMPDQYMPQGNLPGQYSPGTPMPQGNLPQGQYGVAPPSNYKMAPPTRRPAGVYGPADLPQQQQGGISVYIGPDGIPHWGGSTEQLRRMFRDQGSN